MRTTIPRLTVLLAFVVVVFVEFRTLLAFFGIDVSATTTAILGGATILTIVLWATVPIPRKGKQETSTASGSSPEACQWTPVLTE